MFSAWKDSIKQYPWRWGLGLGAMMGIGAVLMAGLPIDLRMLWEHMASWGQAQPVLFGALVFLILLILGFISVVPGGTLLIIGTASVINPWVTMAMALGAETLGSFGMFLVARRWWGRRRGAPPRLAGKLREGYEKHPLAYSLMVRAVPFLPPGGVTLALAWLRCPRWIFLVAGSVSILPFLYLDVSLGAGIAKGMATPEASWAGLMLEPRIWGPLLGLVGLSLLPILWSKWRKEIATKGQVE